MLLDERQCAFDLIRANVNPPPAQLDERLLELRQHLELVAGQRLIAERKLPVIADQAVEVEQAQPFGAGWIGLSRGPKSYADIQSRIEPRQQDAKTASLEQHGLVPHQIGSLASGQRTPLGS